MYSSLIHWFERQRSYMACPSRYVTVRIAQTRRANAGNTQTMCKLCVNSSCQFVSMWTLIGTHSCTRLELFVNNAWTSREQCGSLPVRVLKLARLATTKSWPKVVQVSN